MIRLIEISKWRPELKNNYEILEEAINNFIEKPTIRNKKIVIEKNKEFNKTKIKIIHGIKDLWCKGE